MIQVRCPRCSTMVTGVPGQELSCASCGFRAPVPASVGAGAGTSDRPASVRPLARVEPAPQRPAASTPEPAKPTPSRPAAAASATSGLFAPRPPEPAPPTSDSGAQNEAAEGEPTAAPSKYLVVDDSPTIRKHLIFLLRMLKESDDKIPEASNSAEAIKLFRKHRPEVVFLDMMMPTTKDGIQTLRKILKEEPTQKVVLVTALDQGNNSVLDMVSLGVTAYLRKPITIKALQQVLDEMEAQSGRFRRVG